MAHDENFSSNAAASYRPKGYGISPGLQRARLHFRTRNVVVGVGVASFMVGVWAYSISAVRQNVFDDVDEEARALNMAAPRKEEDRSNPPSAANFTPREVGETAPSPRQDAKASDRPRGILFAELGDKYPWLFEPVHKTLVWGAPPVDNPGRIEDKLLVVWKK